MGTALGMTYKVNKRICKDRAYGVVLLYYKNYRVITFFDTRVWMKYFDGIGNISQRTDQPKDTHWLRSWRNSIAVNIWLVRLTYWCQLTCLSRLDYKNSRLISRKGWRHSACRAGSRWTRCLGGCSDMTDAKAHGAGWLLNRRGGSVKEFALENVDSIEHGAKHWW